MEGCAETLIPNPQKPRPALITEGITAAFSASRVEVSSLQKNMSCFQNYYMRQVFLKRQHTCSTIEIKVCWNFVFVYRVRILEV